jgi:beta-glucosidase
MLARRRTKSGEVVELTVDGTTTKVLEFPLGFVWGAATKSYQVEGSPLADGASASIQHRFAHTPGNTHDGATGDFAADHYRRYSSDAAIIGELGLTAYQFSVAWSRVLPDGTGDVNQRALDHYQRLVDSLLEVGVSPVIMLYDWALPGVLQDQGGWARRDCSRWFAEYSSILFDAFGDRVAHWMTICEPVSVSFSSYVTGRLAPAMRDLHAGLAAVHHVNLGHGLAVQAFRASGAGGEIGTSSLVVDVRALSERDDDVVAAGRVRSYFNELYLDPIRLGRYPSNLVEWFGAAWPTFPEEDLAVISSPIDFVGLTYYYGTTIASTTNPDLRAQGAEAMGAIDQALHHMARMLDVAVVPWNGEVTGIGWPIQPDGLLGVLEWVHHRYGAPPIIVTENGYAADATLENPDHEGQIEDDGRVAYIQRHLAEAHRAISRGVDLRAWFVWSLLDTWEFSMGFRGRFGLVHVDFESLKRTIKRSGHWYSEVVRRNGLLIEDARVGSDCTPTPIGR